MPIMSMSWIIYLFIDKYQNKIKVDSVLPAGIPTEKRAVSTAETVFKLSTLYLFYSLYFTGYKVNVILYVSAVLHFR